MNINPAQDWNKLCDRFYRKFEIYAMAWKNVDLAMFNIAAAPFGGPIALIRDDKKIIKAQKNMSKPDVFIYSAAGQLIANIPWTGAKIVGLKWSENEELVCVSEDGNLQVFDIHGDFVSSYSFGPEVKEYGVADCKICGAGIVIRTTNNNFYALMELTDPKAVVRRFAELPEPKETLHSWIPVEPQYSLTREVEILAAVGTTIFSIDASSAQDQLLTDGPYKEMALSPNGKLLALFSEGGIVWVVSSDFQRNFTELNTRSKTAPLQLVWCGADSVVAYWQKILFMIGPQSDWIKHPYDELVYLVPEIDGIRIIGRDVQEFLQKVPTPLEDVFKSGSDHPASSLYYAMESFEKKSPKADEAIRLIKDQLSLSVDTCIEAAGHEFDQKLQRWLLRAASFGKGFLDYYDPEKFVQMCQTLRVLNAIRSHEVGIAITYTQYELLNPTRIIDRLVLRKQYALASQICQYLKLPIDRVVIHWACAKIKQPEDSEVICQAIISKLRPVQGISFTEIAKVAYKHKGPELATMILSEEPRAAVQVPLLMTMHADDLALTKAIESGDTELVYFVIMRLQQKMQIGDFFRMIQSKPAALDLLITYAKQQDLELLKNLYYQDDKKAEMAELDVASALKKRNLEERIGLLKVALAHFQGLKEPPLLARTIDEQLKLYTAQLELQQQSRERFADLSLSDTIYKCVYLNFSKKASDLKKDFNVPDRRFWWIKIRALAQSRQWLELEKFAKSKKSPIGYEPFIDVCLSQSNSEQAAKYIEKLSPESKVKAFIKVGHLPEAASIAVQLKDEELLNTVRVASKNNREALAILDAQSIKK